MDISNNKEKKKGSNILIKEIFDKNKIYLKNLCKKMDVLNFKICKESNNNKNRFDKNYLESINQYLRKKKKF